MRVLQLIDTFDGGGAERMAVNLANASSRYSLKGYICATRRGGILEESITDEVPTYIAKKRTIYDIRAVRNILRFIKKYDIQIIHAHSTSIYTAFLLKLIKPKLKIVWHDHYGMSEFVTDRPSQNLLKLISTRMFGIVACNEDLAKWSKKTLFCKNVIFLPNFVIENTSCQLNTTIKGTEGKRIICLANLRIQKNHVELLRIFKQLVPLYSNWTLHLVGKDFKDSVSASVREYIKKNNLEDSIYMYGSREDVTAILQQMDIGVLVSKSEGLPLALLEYGMAGLAVLVTDVGQCAQVVGETGSVVRNLNEEGARALSELMRNAVHRREQGAKFKKRIKQNYSESSSLLSLKEFYKA